MPYSDQLQENQQRNAPVCGEMFTPRNKRKYTRT